MKKRIHLLPGFMTDERLWSRLRPLLEDEYELIHVQLPTTSDFDEMIAELKEIFPNEKLNLLGFSLGGYVASYYALKNPKQVKNLFLVAATPSATSCTDVKRREEKILNVKEAGHVELSVKKAKELLECSEDEELIALMVDMFNEMGVEYFVPHLLSTLKRQNLHGKLNELELNVAMLYSKEDRLLNHAAMKEMQNGDYHFTIDSREGSSHSISLEDPELLALKIKAWLT